MGVSYANHANVSVCGERIHVQFGIEHARQAGQEKLRGPLVQPFSLSPAAAKRLAQDLTDAVREQEARRGVELLHISDCAEVQERPGSIDSRPGSTSQVADVLTLFRGIGMANSLVDIEHSFKLTEGALFDNRILLGLKRAEWNSRLDETVAEICENIGMPHKLQAEFRKELSAANHIYFGAEKDGCTLLFKAYLEFRDRVEREIAGLDVFGQSFRLFTGFKWDTSAPDRQVVTGYAWYPSLALPEILRRMRGSLDPERSEAAINLFGGMVERAAASIVPSEIQYLEVSEDGNPRCSFDVNLYKAGLRLADVLPQLLRAFRRYGIPKERFEPLVQRIRSSRLGHLAGGIDRQNREFLTIYYGAGKVHSSQLASAQRSSARG